MNEYWWVIATGIFTIGALVIKRYYGPSNVESLIPEENIRIIEIIDDHDHGITEDELCRYLEHHIELEGPDNFDKKTFEHPVTVRFKYRNEIYSMVLKGMTSTKDDHKEIKKTPKCLSAIIRYTDSQGKTNESCVTERIREFHGHSKNFFDHIPDVISDLDILLKGYKGQLHTYDMMGNTKVVEL